MERGLLGIAAVAAGTALAAAGLQQALRQARPELTSESSDRLVHRTGRFDPDPGRRRQARRRSPLPQRPLQPPPGARACSSV